MKHVGTPWFYVDSRPVRRHQIASMVARESRHAPRVTITLNVAKADGKAKVTATLTNVWPVPKGTQVFAVLFTKRTATKCTAGENHGKTLDEVFVVLDAGQATAYAGEYTHEFNLPKNAKDLGVALLVENPTTMKTLGCAQAPVR